MSKTITAGQAKQWLDEGGEIAFLDVREHGQYGEEHPFFVVSVPYSRLELDAERLVPRKRVSVVLLDEGDGVAERAAARLEALGYGQVHVLRGGVAAWKAEGYGMFQGVHLPSKTFGELVEHAYHTPRLQAQELAAMQARGEAVVVLDGRPVDEFRKMNIPGAVCCPNGELALRIHALVPDDATPVVVNCAGRTRSIIGAQTLINIGIPNPVYALENGTQGWYLNDLALEHGNDRRYPQVDAAAPALQARRDKARELAGRHGVGDVDAATLAGWMRQEDRTTFLLDVRTGEEFAAGTLPGAQHAPGGQLLQGTDLYVGVKGARLVVADDDGIRARVVASWLAQMGREIHVLPAEEWARARAELPAPVPATAVPGLPVIEPAELAGLMAAGAVQILDVRASMAYRQAHIAGARWAIRPRMAGQAQAGGLVFVATSAELAALAASELPDEIRAGARVLVAPVARWREAGLAIEATPDTPADADCIDFLFFVHDRHDGNKEAARRYLAWETGLIGQLDARERGAYRISP
ncbi:rhodanese-like domain-containing protein [Pigmentiphaga kullae]|uniref:Rhodanese-related sulfurtransferase n=1 Tax=Pigmentiphaga kullae TaxID=151784 RepID=A0A4Q7N9I0_9BURK|nr:rhodanese-like domain-containing protein [Pigmentiphaga kullae]RZS78760.1 rhodanese-related sulfurtransferase [Pigmentiphaga kullae]